MLKLLARIAMFFFAIALFLDVLLPTVSQTSPVDRHRTIVDNHMEQGRRSDDTNYNIEFSEGNVRSCSVGYSLYSKLHDGDAVTVQSSKVSKQCIKISRNDEVLYDLRYWKFLRIAFGLLLIAIAFGWVNTEENEVRFRV